MIQIINNDESEIKEFHKAFWGESDEILTYEHIAALEHGKLIAYSDGEYSTTFKLNKEALDYLKEKTTISKDIQNYAKELREKEKQLDLLLEEYKQKVLK